MKKIIIEIIAVTMMLSNSVVVMADDKYEGEGTYKKQIRSNADFSLNLRGFMR